MYYSWLYTCFLYTGGCYDTMKPYIYDDDDHSISGGYIHTMDLRLLEDPFSFGSLCPYCGYFHMFLSIRMVASIPWIHVLIYMTEVWDMYMYMHPWFTGLLMVFVLVHALACKASQPSLHVLPSFFRGNLLHSILSHLLHFPVSYPGVSKPWQLCSVSILICTPVPPWITNEKLTWALPEKNALKTLIYGLAGLWHYPLMLMAGCTIWASHY